MVILKIGIKYGNIIGYIFSGNLAHERLINDIDNNGIKDFFLIEAELCIILDRMFIRIFLYI
jgi:hypothetical protein